MRGGLSAAAHSRAITETPPLIRLRSGAADTFPEGEGFPNKNAVPHPGRRVLYTVYRLIS